jgi:hypothetical protein
MSGIASYIFVGVMMAVAATGERVALIWFHRNWFRQGFAGDGAFHLAVVRELQRTGSYAGMPYFLMSDEKEPDTYPILFHRFAALFSGRLIETRPYLPSLVLWVVLSTAAALYAQYVATVLLHRTGFAAVAVFIVLFLTAASNLSLESNGLNYISLSERLLARFACAFCFTGLAVAMMFGDPVSYGVAIAGGVATALTSMFGRQVVVFVLPLMALLSRDPRPLYLLAVSAVGATLIDGNYFLRGLRHMAMFSYAYHRLVKHSPFFKSALSRWVNWRIVFGRHGGLNARLGEIQSGEPTQLLARLPELGLLVYFWVSGGGAEAPAVAALIACGVVYLLTTTPALRQFGESIRYFEYSAWLLVPLLIAIHLTGSVVVPIGVLAIYAACVALFTYRRIAVWLVFTFPAKDQMRELVERAGITADSTVFTVPLHLGAEVSARAMCRSFNYQGSAVTLEVYRRFAETPPLLKRDWRSLARQYNVTHIVADKRYLQWIPTIVDWTYDFNDLPILGESDFYIAYSVPTGALEAGAS